MDAISEGLRKLILAGIGAVAATKEKSEVILDELVKKGELTVEQGKVLQLHHMLGIDSCGMAARIREKYAEL